MTYMNNLEIAIYLITAVGSVLGAYMVYKIYNSEDGFR